MLTVLSPWVIDDRGSHLGLSQPDGLLTLFVGSLALAVAWRGLAFGWIVSGFLAILLGRDLMKLIDFPSARPGFGLWLGAIAFTIAALIQFLWLARSTLRRGGDG